MNTILKHSPGQVQDVIQNIKKEKMIPGSGIIKIMIFKVCWEMAKYLLIYYLPAANTIIIARITCHSVHNPCTLLDCFSPSG